MMTGRVEIRREQPGDVAAIRNVHDLAFGRPAEGTVVDRLREVCPECVSLVAVVEGRIVGHVFFSPVVLESDEGRAVTGMGLAPLALLPEHQGQGIGTELAASGLALARELACPFVVVLGHPGYYPRFGFERASRHGIRCQWEVPDEVFMVLVVGEDAIRGAKGVARYRSEWSDAT
jgi:putative acetyltransferase